MALRIIIPPGFDQQLKAGILKEAPKVLAQKATAVSTQLLGDIRNILINAVLATPVVQSLIANTPVDLGAHLGLRTGEGAGLVKGMLDIIKNAVTIVIANKLNGVIQIRAIESDFQTFLSLPGAIHINERTNTIVPVVQWLLIDPDTDIGQAGFDIVFRGREGGRFDVGIQRVSRSGRAIMIALEKLSGGSKYVLPDLIRFASGKNFILSAVTQTTTIENIEKALIKRLQ